MKVISLVFQNQCFQKQYNKEKFDLFSHVPKSVPLYAELNAGIASETLLFTTMLLLMQKL